MPRVEAVSPLGLRATTLDETADHEALADGDVVAEAVDVLATIYG